MSLKSKWIVVAATAVSLSGCADYLSRHDGITLGAGDAMEANVGIHTIHPFPPDARNTHIESDGTAVANAQNRYVIPGDPDVVPSAGAGAASAGN